MKKIRFILAGILLAMLDNTTVLAEISGESELFTFNTRDAPPIPLSYLGITIAMALVATYLIWRYDREKSKTTLASGQRTKT